MSSEQQFVKFSVTVLDWRRHLSAIDWTVLTVIHDKISRWDKVRDSVSISQIEVETTLSKTSIKKSLARLCKSDGPLEVVGRGVRRIPVYSIRPCDRVALRPGDLATGSPGALYQNGTQGRPAPPSGSTGSSGALMEESTGSSGALMEGATGSSGAPTTDVLPATNRDPVKDPLYIESGQGAEIPVASATSELLKEDGGVVKTNNTVNQDPDGVRLEANPLTSKNKTFIAKSGRTWELGVQDAECLAYELEIKLGEAEALLKDGNGKDAGQILAMLRKSWKQIKANGRTVGYMRGVIRNSVSKGKASELAAPTSNPLPRSAAPLPTPAPAEPAARANLVYATDSMVDVNESAGSSGDWEEDAEDEPADKATGSGLFDDDEEKETQEKAAPHAAITMRVQALTTAGEPTLAPQPICIPAPPAPQPAVETVAAPTMLADLSWPDQVVWFIAHGEQNLDAIAAAIDQPLGNVKDVIHNHGDVETRSVNGRAHYYVPSAPAPLPAQEPAAAPKEGTASSRATEAATAPTKPVLAAAAKVLSFLAASTGWSSHMAVMDCMGGVYVAGQISEIGDALSDLVDSGQVLTEYQGRFPHYRLAAQQQEAPPTEPKERSRLHIGSGIFGAADSQMESAQPEPRSDSQGELAGRLQAPAEPQKPAREDLRIEDDWAPDESREGAGDGPVDDDSDDPF